MKKKLIIFFYVLILAIVAYAQIPERPDPPRLVNDFAYVLKDDEAIQMENFLEQFARETSTQIVFVSVKDLQGYDPSDFAFRIGEKWGVGQKDKDNGLVILLKPKQENSKGEIFIATGYGMEGILPDGLLNGKIIEHEMIPYFKENNYFAGLMSGMKIITDISRGEYTAEQYQQKASDGGSIIPVIIFLVLIFVILPMIRSKNRRFYEPGKHVPFWIALTMLSGRNRHDGMFDDFSSGSGGFGGGGGGGFGGFGGGSFGGGGAGGSW